MSKFQNTITLNGSSVLNASRCDAGTIGDKVRNGQFTPLQAAREIMKGRKTRGAHAAVVAGCVTAALVESGHANQALAVLLQLSDIAECGDKA